MLRNPNWLGNKVLSEPEYIPQNGRGDRLLMGTESWPPKRSASLVLCHLYYTETVPLSCHSTLSEFQVSLINAMISQIQWASMMLISWIFAMVALVASLVLQTPRKLSSSECLATLLTLSTIRTWSTFRHYSLPRSADIATLRTTMSRQRILLLGATGAYRQLVLHCKKTEDRKSVV